MADGYHYRNLILWQKAQELAFDIIQVVKALPDAYISTTIAQQIIRSATSIAANIAEGHGRFSPGAHRNHLSIAKGSAAETDSWLDLLRREGLLSVDEEDRLHNQCSQIIGMLTKKIQQLDKIASDKRNLREQVAEYHTEDSAEPPSPFTEADYRRAG